jgi:hypothetical protein
MTTFRIVSVAAVLALSAAVSLAQNAKPAPAEKATAPTQECDKAKHDHGADKGTPTPKSVRCAAEANKGKTTSKAHDHAKVHK